MRGIEREQSWVELFEGTAASRAAHFRAHDGDSILGIDEPSGPAANLERALRQVARFGDAFFVNDANDDIDAVFPKTFKFSEFCDWHEMPVNKERVESVALGPPGNVGVKSLARFHQGRQHFQR